MMKITDKLRGALRRIVGEPASTGARKHDRRTLALPSILDSYSPRAEALPKRTPMNLRRFAETPLARKAINSIKDRVAGMRWRIQPKNGRDLATLPQGEERIRTLTDNFDSPNPDDSFRSLAEQVLEDIIVGGYGALELQLTGTAERPLAMWPIDGASIKLRAEWSGEPGEVRYLQATGRFGAEANIALADEELSYIRLNPRTHTPFGLGRLEVAFETVN